MDHADYLPMFLAECREHLQELGLALVAVEERPDDRDTIDEIFRIAHSLKGMSATMGFDGMAVLTHEMEDVFELLRQREGVALERTGIDVLLECLDALEAAVESIDQHGEERCAPAPLVARLRALRGEAVMVGAAGAVEDPVAAPEALDAAADVPSSSPPLRQEGGVRLAIELAEDVAMPSVRAYMALEALAEHGEIVVSTPPADAVDGFEGRRIDVEIVSEAAHETLVEAVRDVGDVAAVHVAALDARSDDAAPAASAAHDAAPRAAAPPDAPSSAALSPDAAPPDVPSSDGLPSDAAPSDAPPPDAAPHAGALEHQRKPAARRTASVRVEADRLDLLMHHMGELVVHRTHVEALAEQAGVPGLTHAMQDLTRSSQALQAMVMQVRMIPVEAVFLRFPRVVRDLSGRLGKQVELVLEGTETELDRTVVDALGDPLVHLVRNALDHGLEPPEERVAAGKPPTGTLTIAARHAGGNVIIDVADDGRGIDPERVARAAVRRGMLSAEAAAALDAREAIELLFAPGFSTAETTSDISGRGVGMDAVRAMIRDLGGEVVLHTRPGAGTTAQVRLPLTLAIMAALLVEAAGLPFAIPLDRVERTVRLTDHTVRAAAGEPMLVMGERVIPLQDAGVVLQGAEREDHDYAVVVRSHDRELALAVTRLVGQRELVTRPLPSGVGRGAPVSGGAVLSDGRITLIVDCDELTAPRLHEAASAAPAAGA